MKKLETILLIFLLFNISIDLSFSQWSQVGQLSGLSSYPRISVVDSSVVWAAGGVSGAVVYRTVNGGLNWTSIPTTGLPYLLSGIAAKDAQTAFVTDLGSASGAGGNAKIFKTTNGGLSWVFIDSSGGTQGYFNDIVFSKSVPDFGVAMSDPPNGGGTPFYLSKTANGGIDWTRTSAPGIISNFGLFRSQFVIDPQFYGFMTLNLNTSFSNSYITSNGGSSWYLGDESIGFSSSGGDLVFHDNKLTGIMVAVGSIPNIKRTTNGGVNWVIINTMSDLSGFVNASWISGTNTVFICGNNSVTNSCIIRSDDAGLTWVSQGTGSPAGFREIDYSRYTNLIVAFAVTAPGQVVKSRQIVQPVGIQPLGNAIPMNYSLSQNYPNPFNPKTIIHYQLPASNYVSLKVYDALGKNIAILVNKRQNAGYYQVEFEGNSLPSGIYFCTLETEVYTKTMRMTLIK